MAKKKVYLIKSVLGGQSPATYFGQEGQFLASVGIDPELPINSSVVDRPSGAIVPSRYETFSSTIVNSAPMWIETNPKNENIYSYLANGRFVSHSNVFGSETNIGTPTSGAGNGMKYYDNYIYLFTPTDVSRYGPLSGSASITNTYWTSSLSKSPLIDTTYPGNRNITFPNHAAHVHAGKLYFLDFTGGVGKVHFIQTTKTTVEGDTDNGSTYGALSLPIGYYPFDLESYGSDLVIVCSQLVTGSPVIKQGRAMLFFWDTFSPKPYRAVELPDALATAILTHNGSPYIWSGAIERGVRLSKYVGGNQVEPVISFNEGTPPSAGAVDSMGNRIIWGGWGTKPITNVGVYAMGYVNSQLPSKALNQIAHVPTVDSLQVVSSLKFVQEGGRQPIIGWRTNSSSYGISKASTTASFGGFSIWQSEVVSVGQPFKIKKIRFPLGAAVATNMNIAPTVYVDDLSSSTALDTISTTLFSGKYNAPINCSVNGQHNFLIQLSFTNTVILPVLLPIEVTVELLND